MSSGRPARANLTDEASPFLLSHVPVREGERDEEARDQIHLLLEHVSGVKGIVHPKIIILGSFYSTSDFLRQRRLYL